MPRRCTTIVIVLDAAFPIDPERRDDAVELFRDVAEASLAEDGVLAYRVAAGVDDENRFQFFERYEDEAAFAAHGESAHVERLGEELPELLAGEPEVTRYDVDSASAVEL